MQIFILGVDEAGRGPLAGPLAVGVVAHQEGIDLLEIFPKLNDSKKLSPAAREKLFTQLEEVAKTKLVRYAVHFSSAADIDSNGLTHSIKSALNKGVYELLPNAAEGKVYLDGSLSAPIEYTQETIVGGDGIHPAIMLASVAAKVLRDRYMVEIDSQYPEYGFAIHKGYGTKAHYEALTLHGSCPEHRQLFLRTFNEKEKAPRERGAS